MMPWKTPAELAALGFPTDQPIVWDSPEYWRRIEARMPQRAPLLNVGDWSYNYLANENQRVLAVYWDDGGICALPTWRYNFPGASFTEVWGGPRSSAPFVEYVETSPDSHCWRRRTVADHVAMVEPEHDHTISDRGTAAADQTAPLFHLPRGCFGAALAESLAAFVACEAR